MNWSTAIDLYTAHLRAGAAAPGTIETRRHHLQRTARAMRVGPWDVVPADLLAWYAAQTWARETRRSFRQTLMSFYRWGMQHGARADASAVLPAVKPSRPAPRPVTDEAYRHALARADERVRLMVRLAGECGLRRAEVAAVHTSDLLEDLDGWSLRVFGKGERERIVPLPDALAVELRGLPAGYAFPGEENGHLSARWVGTLVSRALPDGWTMHKLRHRAATRWYAVDRDTFTVQDLLGHASPVTTRAYVAVPRTSLRRTVEAAL